MTDYTIASPNGGTWTIQSTNSATVGRYHDLALLMEGASGSGNVFKQSRPGILVGPPSASSTNIPAAFAIAPTSGLGFNIQPGAGIVERSTLVGSYTVESTATGTGAVGTADPSQTRVDRVDLQVLDGSLGDNGGTSKTSVKVTAGTPGGGTPAAPSNSVPLGIWTIPATTTTLTSGMWTDTRKSAGIRGCTRVMLPGDALADTGFMIGEERRRFHSTYGWLTDVWDASTATWRGQQRLALSAVPSGNIACTLNTWNTVATVSITDPGWPYLLEVSANTYYSAGANNIPNAVISLDSTSGPGLCGTLNTVSNAADYVLVISPHADPGGTTRTGAHTIRLLVDSSVSGTCFATIAALGPSTWLKVDLIPV